MVTPGRLLDDPRMSVPTRLISRRELNRALLARQLLLQRTDMSVTQVVERLVGVQAQTPHTWYAGLWSRIDAFRPEDAGNLLSERGLVRIALMRSTIHLVSAADCLPLRRLVQPVLDRWLNATYGRRLVGVERDELIAASRVLMDERPRTFSELGAALAERWPDHDTDPLAMAVRGWVPLVQVPPRGVWGRSGPIAHTSAETWLGSGLADGQSRSWIVLRYLGAFGPASVKDVQLWSGLTRLNEVVDELRPQLVTFRDESGRELFDVPGAPRPAADTPAPVRFLYDFDNLLLSHADRRRVITDDYRRQDRGGNGQLPSIILVDGFTSGDWRVTRDKTSATLLIRPWVELSKAVRAELAEEGARLLAFAASDASAHDIRFLPVS